MTSRERVMTALAHREPDRTPIFEYVLQPPMADAILGRAYVYGNRLSELIEATGWECALRSHARDMVELAQSLGHDLIYIVPNPPQPRTGKEQITTAPPVALPSDPVEQMAVRIQVAEESFADPPEEMFLIYRLIREEMERVGEDLPILSPAYGHGVWTDAPLMQAMVVEPELARRHFALATCRCLMMVERYQELSVDMIGVGGDFAGNQGPLISPRLYREFMVPGVRAVSGRVHEYGMTAINASDGNLWSVMDDFLLGCEVDGYLEIDLRAGMELPELKKRYGDRITFFGNLDCANDISFGTPEQVKTATLRCLRDGWGGGGHVLCCNNAITASVPVANYLAIYEAYRELFGL